jgi:hypothetical protein
MTTLNAVPVCFWQVLTVADGGKDRLGLGRVTELAAHAAAGNLGHLGLRQRVADIQAVPASISTSRCSTWTTRCDMRGKAVVSIRWGET